MSGYTGRLNQRVQLKNLLTFTGRLPVVITLTGKVLRSYLGPPKKVAGNASDSTPRDLPPYHLYFALRTVGVNAIVPTPGSVVVDPGGKEYEVLGQPREMLANRRVYGYEVPVLPIELLYPNTGTTADPNGGTVEVPFSMWPGTETPEQRGEYDNMLGEAPASAWELLRVTNATLKVGEDVFRVTSALLNLEQPHVALRLRRRDS